MGGGGVKIEVNGGDFKGIVSWSGFKGIKVNRVKAGLIVGEIGIEEMVDKFEFGFNF